MSLFFLNRSELWFPVVNEMSGDIVAVGGDLRPERLILAYSMGIYPWYQEPGNILWWCPEDRAVLFLPELHISHSMRSELRKGRYRWTMDQAFERVIAGCRSGDREGQTWILPEVEKAYVQLHQRGFAHSVEVWEGGELAGGLYGVCLGNVFFGESMFTLRPNASKFGFIHLCLFLREMGWKLVDCQVLNPHLESLGARNIDRETFLETLKVEMKFPSVRGDWSDPETWNTGFKRPHQP